MNIKNVFIKHIFETIFEIASLLKLSLYYMLRKMEKTSRSIIFFLDNPSNSIHFPSKLTSEVSMKVFAPLKGDFRTHSDECLFRGFQYCESSLNNFCVIYDSPLLFTFFYVSRRKYWFRANFRFPVFDGFTPFGMS